MTNPISYIINYRNSKCRIFNYDPYAPPSNYGSYGDSPSLSYDTASEAREGETPFEPPFRRTIAGDPPSSCACYGVAG